MAAIELEVGPQIGQDGATSLGRAGKTGEQIIGDGHARFQEPTYRGNVYTFGLSNTALVAANAIATGLTATAQPIIALYNPSTSTVNLAIWQAIINTTTIANTAVSPGGFMWVYSVGNNAVSTGSTPINCKTLLAAGSQARAFAVSTALTGLTTNLAVLRASAINSINAAGPATAITQPVNGGVENVDGSIIVPPGGVVGIMGQVATTTVSVSVGILWEEILL